MIRKPVRLAWLATHPIQYQAPLFRSIANSKDIDLNVLFFSDFSTRDFVDPEFGKKIQWDTPLLEGYKHQFLAGTGKHIKKIRTFQPIIFGLRKKLIANNFDAVMIQGWNHYGMILGALFAKKEGLKVFLRCEATDHVQSSSGIKRMIRDFVVSILLKKTDFFMAIGTNNKNFYLNRGVEINRIGLMPYCVDNNFFSKKSRNVNLLDLRKHLNIVSELPIILYAGKLIKRKFPDLLLDAYISLPDPKPYLIYVGDGEQKESLDRKIKENDLQSVRMVGFVNQSALPSYYLLADIFVLPSINETWGLVINEAMNASCAIITTNQVGSAFDLVENGKNGFVIKPNKINELSDALRKCMEGQLYKKMGINSLEKIKKWGIKENVKGLTKSLKFLGFF
jgi:glycosyltransferase involved in cell wall biosynthesis